MVLQFKNENSNHIMWPQMSNLPSRLLGLFDLERGIAQTFGVLSTIWKPHKLAAVERFTLEGTTHSSWALCFLGSEESSINLVCILQTIKTNWHISQHLCQPTLQMKASWRASTRPGLATRWNIFKIQHFVSFTHPGVLPQLPHVLYVCVFIRWTVERLLQLDLTW